MMGWSIGYDSKWRRDIGYGVPAICDYPRCHKNIDRGLAYVCGGELYGGEDGCGLFFCYSHLGYAWRGPDEDEMSPQLCERCLHNFELGEDRWEEYLSYFEPKSDVRKWIKWKLTDDSWADWRSRHPEEVKQMKAAL